MGSFRVYHKHVMIDVETFGTKQNAIVASIGAVAFNEKAIDEKNGFYSTISWDDQLKHGGTVTEDTLRFWLRQADKVREPLLRQPGKLVAVVLSDLKAWFVKQGMSNKDFLVWAKGPQFDLSLINSLYDRFDIQSPWLYWQERDVRTALMLDAAYQIGRPQDSDAHHAFDDAVFQAKQVRRFLVATGGVAAAKRHPEANAGKGEDNANAETDDLFT